MSEEPQISVPSDHSINQPARAYCRNPECVESGDKFIFDIQHDGQACPKCGADRLPYVGLLILTHLIVRDPKGPIQGVGGLRYSIACDQKRAWLATLTNKEAATDNKNLFNCRLCEEAIQRTK